MAKRGVILKKKKSREGCDPHSQSTRAKAVSVTGLGFTFIQYLRPNPFSLMFPLVVKVVKGGLKKTDLQMYLPCMYSLFRVMGRWFQLPDLVLAEPFKLEHRGGETRRWSLKDFKVRKEEVLFLRRHESRLL